MPGCFYFASDFFVIAFITKRNATVRTAPMGSVIHALCTKPATMYITNEIAATEIA